MSTTEFIMWFLFGSLLVLCAGWVAWNARLTYYRIWCWVNYRTHIVKQRHE